MVDVVDVVDMVNMVDVVDVVDVVDGAIYMLCTYQSRMRMRVARAKQFLPSNIDC